ncbi:MAG TPA: acetyl/propionyl/methylcrotonyl-CoA carboxylase subunit alpha [Anaerolineae bacterium]|nr:acetyl/propionyl/methylcrotonyl-CoA carboxylase subunit alpha [Anaerolineae bacterium]
MIHSLLIANRGEIACRIIRTCRQMGIRTVAVFSDADREARHVRLADTAVHIGPAPATDSYLNIEAIITAARQTGADAIHPGFGFLAENGEFARAVAAAGLIFIGPTPEAIEAMGNKRAAKEMMAAASVPVLPGYGGADQSDRVLLAEAEHIGFPIMVKAAAGGGGKGMRLVHKLGDLPEAMVTARREALQAFGSDELILERALLRPRHVEIQVMGDAQGNVIHLGERECSIQRRHQKIIEESPSPAVDGELRRKMGETAVLAAQTIQYTNAGTVEFLLDEDGQFYFLEMNTRLQVEHPVTELVTGIDLVAWQIRIAEGQPLPLTQTQVQWHGHAIEARVYAENPANDFLPVIGDVLLWREPDAPGIRVDSGIETGDVVSVHYDPMLAKIIAFGAEREEALRRLIRALETTALLGFTQNIPFLLDVLRQPAFAAGDLHTGFIDIHLADWQPPPGDTAVALIAATLAQFTQAPQRPENAGYWRNNQNNPPLTCRYLLDGAEADVQLWPEGTVLRIAYQDNETDHASRITHHAGPDWTLEIDGTMTRVTAVSHNNIWYIQTETGTVTLPALPRLPEPQPPADVAGSLRAPMPGSILELLVKVGDTVQAGQPLLKLEAMKMEHTIRAAGDGIVETIYFAPGDAVEADAQLLHIKPGTTDSTN